MTELPQAKCYHNLFSITITYIASIITPRER